MDALLRRTAYNAEMGANLVAEIDAWVRAGGMVLAASDRARRASLAAFHRARQAAGLTAWTAPPIFDWNNFARTQWEQRAADLPAQDLPLVLNDAQERALWEQAIAAHHPRSAVLRPPLRRLAAMASDAHGLLCAHAPRLLDERQRRDWQQDQGAFSQWLTTFHQSCRTVSAIGAARLAVELPRLLAADSHARPPLLLIGFDRLSATQQSVLNTWGAWQHAEPAAPATHIVSYTAADADSELTACALWCAAQIAAHPEARILVLTQDAALRRGAIERAFLAHAQAPFEFSLGVPVAAIPVVRAAQLMLRWFSEPLQEQELDWLFSVPRAVRNIEETTALQNAMRSLRRSNLQRPQWSLSAFLRTARVPDAWRQRMQQAQSRIGAFYGPASPLDLAPLATQVLESIGWPGDSALASAEYQAVDAFHQALDNCASLAFDNRLLSWSGFYEELAGALAETLFAPQSQDAPILIAGPAESAGLTADAIWFLGTDEDHWPAHSSTHPLIPLELQREHRMPHASPQLDWELAQAVTARVIASAPQVCFSHPRQVEAVAMRASRLIAQFAPAPQPIPAEYEPPAASIPSTITVQDTPAIPFSSHPDVPIPGGAAVLTAQSQCPFQAFGRARLGADAWDPAEPALSPLFRGDLLHRVLREIWSGPPVGIHSLDDLLKLSDRLAFVTGHVCNVFNQHLPPAARDEMPPRYLELEQVRLARLLVALLDYESSRKPFTVADREVERSVNVAGLPLKLRLDRLDHLADGSVLVVDYKSGDVKPNEWNTPRPQDVQLPLYAEFALHDDESLGGLVFAKIRAGKVFFTGRVSNPADKLGAVSNIRSLQSNSLQPQQRDDWRKTIEELASDFLAGRADVDPREAKTCTRCGLHTVCRIAEREILAGEEDEESEDTE